MKEFTALNITCLKDMQMLLDAIADTTFKINQLLSIERNKLSKYLKENLPINYRLSEWEQEIDILSQDDSNDRLLISDLDICYSTTIDLVNKKESIRYFDLFIGYVSDKKQNVIYAHVLNDSETLILTESLISELKGNISKDWICDSDNTREESNIYIEFPIDENFSIERIENCIQVFKDFVLQPIINKLQA